MDLKRFKKKETEFNLKKERRRIEKSKKRMRDKICFGCRQFGHLLINCSNSNSIPETDPCISNLIEHKNGIICFKCGSTEHMSRNCKKKSEEYNFAKCFICSKIGHISRQCPKNTKGIYPSGGKCNLCDQLTHLAKDCPTLQRNETKPSTTNTKNEPVVQMLLNPYVSTEYEPEMSNIVVKKTISKKRHVKF